MAVPDETGVTEEMVKDRGFNEIEWREEMVSRVWDSLPARELTIAHRGRIRQTLEAADAVPRTALLTAQAEAEKWKVDAGRQAMEAARWHGMYDTQQGQIAELEIEAAELRERLKRAQAMLRATPSQSGGLGRED